jgi:hypothetical protein
MPKSLSSRPELTERQVQIYNAFLEVGTTRSYTMSGAQPLSLLVLLGYCQLYDLDRDEAQALWQILRRVDEHWLAKTAPPAPKTSKAKAKTA